MEKTRDPHLLSWKIDINILKSLSIIKDVFKVLIISFGFVFSLLLFLWIKDGLPRIIDLSNIKFALALLIFSIIILIIFIKITSNTYSVFYELTEKGAKFKTTQNQNKKNKIKAMILIAIGFIFNNPTAIGIGFLSKSNQDFFTKWEKVKKIVYFTKRKEIHLYSSGMTKNILFCNEKNIIEVLSFVSFYSNKSKIFYKK